MSLYKLIILFLLIFGYACSSENLTTLPTSVYFNVDLDSYSTKAVINVSQSSDNLFNIEYENVYTGTIDSTLHVELSKIKFPPYVREVTVKFQLDKDLKYSEFEKLVNEFRKVNLRRFCMDIGDNRGIQYIAFPYDYSENLFIDPSINIVYPPPAPYLNKESLSKVFPNLIYSVENSKVKIHDHIGNEITDNKNFIKNRENAFHFLKMNKTDTYQDYITVTSYIRSSIEGIRKSTIDSNNIDYKEAKKLYPMRIEKL